MKYIIIWLLCGFLVFGASNADIKQRYPGSYERRDYSQCGVLFFFGPVGLVAVFLYTGFFQYGFDWTWEKIK